MFGSWRLGLLLSMTLAAACGQRPQADPALDQTTKPPVQASTPPTAGGPLPDTAFKLTWTNPILPSSMAHGGTYAIAVAFTNASPDAWPDPKTADPQGTTGGAFAVRLSYRWLTSDGKPVGDYVERAELTKPLAPGATTALALMVVAPEKPGSYKLQFDLVQELVCWFGDRPGVPKLVVPLTVK